MSLNGISSVDNLKSKLHETVSHRKSGLNVYKGLKSNGTNSKCGVNCRRKLKQTKIQKKRKETHSKDVFSCILAVLKQDKLQSAFSLNSTHVNLEFNL